MSDRKTTELIYQNYIFLYTNQLLLFSSEFVDIDMADDVKYIFYCLGMDIDILEDKFAPPNPTTNSTYPQSNLQTATNAWMPWRHQ